MADPFTVIDNYKNTFTLKINSSDVEPRDCIVRLLHVASICGYNVSCTSFRNACECDISVYDAS